MIFKHYRNDNNNESRAAGTEAATDRETSGETGEKTANIRQLPASQQNQILSALDTLGAKLVRSETERETMRKLLGEALDAQERLENQLERSQMDLQRRLDNFENMDSVGEQAKARFDEQDKAIAEGKADMQAQKDRQVRVEDKLRDSQQTIAKLQRRVDVQEQKRARLQRRIERVENIAAEARNALEAKAVVLLSDQSRAAAAQLPYIDASAPLQAIESLHNGTSDGGFAVKDISRHKSRSWLSGAAVAAIVIAALGVGWLSGAVYHARNDKAFAVLQDGTLAQIDAETGTAQIVRFTDRPQTYVMADVPPAEPTVADDIDNEVAALETEWIMEEFLHEATLELAAADAEKAAADAVLPAITIKRDPALPAAIKSIEDKAFEGVPEAQHDLAALYTAGQAGVAQNYERAAYWFKQAAQQGIGNAAYNLGVLYHQGLGQEQDTGKAMDWYARAAQLGHPEAQYNLGIAYIEGIGTRYNPNMAAAFFQQAALGGIVEAAYNLGLILENGLLGEARPIDALRWYRGAAEKGSIEAEAALADLSGRLNIPREQAGLLPDGASVARYMEAADSIEPAAGGDQAGLTRTPEDISLGNLVPGREQIVIAQIQGQLRKMQYYDGPQDGIHDADTIAAIKSYQIYENLPVNGRASEDLLSHMLERNTAGL